MDLDILNLTLNDSTLQNIDIESYWPSGNEIEATDVVDHEEYTIFLQFYQSLLDYFTLDKTFPPSHVQYALAVHDFSQFVPEPNYDRRANCLGYLQMNAAFNAAVAYNAAYRIFQSNPPTAIRRMLTLKDELGIVCLGSGPGNDLLGLLGGLYGKHYGLLKLDVTAADRMMGWKEIHSEAHRRLRDDDFGNASKLLKEVEVTDSFEPTDLTLPLTWTDTFKQKLRNADIITLAHFLSVVSNVQKVNILESLVEYMKVGSVLIFIDRLFPSVEFDALKDDLELVYDATIEKFRYDYEVERFGFNNITSSPVYIRAFERKFVLKRHLV